MYATRLLDALIETSNQGLALRALSPSTVIVDETGVGVRVLVLPLAYNVDRQYAAAAARNGRPVANEEVHTCTTVSIHPINTTQSNY